MTNNQNPADVYFGRDLEAMAFGRNYHRWITDRFKPYTGRRITEVGAGSGNFTEFIVEGWHPESLICLEPSANMFPILDSRWAATPVVHPFRGCLADWIKGGREPADTICYVNVLEHIEDDAAELDLAYQSLRSGGHLLIFVPALPWLFGTADENFGHFRRYTRESLLEVVAGIGFEIRECAYFDVAGILPWWASFVVLRQKTLSPGMMALYDRMVVPIMRRIETSVPVPIGKNLLLAARKS